MDKMPDIGKISPEIFNELIYPRLGAKSKSILVGPQHGVDVGIVEIGNMAVSVKTDPVFIVPEYGWEKAAWFAVHILASDSVTCALKPRFLAIDLNLPMAITEEQLGVMWDTIHKECVKLDISIITGHTARYDNCNYPFVGGATIIGVGSKDEYVTPKFAAAGDKIIITKGPAIEATGIFAAALQALWKKNSGLVLPRKPKVSFIRCRLLKMASRQLPSASETTASPLCMTLPSVEFGGRSMRWDMLPEPVYAWRRKKSSSRKEYRRYAPISTSIHMHQSVKEP